MPSPYESPHRTTSTPAVFAVDGPAGTTIRTATSADAAGIEVVATATGYSEFDAEHARQFLAIFEAHIVVAEFEGEVVGFLAASPGRATSPAAKIQSVSTQPKWVDLGVGRALVEAGLTMLFGAGAPDVSVTVRFDRARARAVYSDIGFVDVESFSGPDGFTWVTMMIPRPSDPAPADPWPPLMRAADVNELWQAGAWNVAVARRNPAGLLDWLPLNEVCESRHGNPFLGEWPNLLVVAAPWEGSNQMPVPPGAEVFDVESGETFDPTLPNEFPLDASKADPVAGELFATEYIMDAFEPDDPDHGIWQVRVVWRGSGLWAVQQGGFSIVLNTDGEWEHEPSPSNRDDDFLESHRFPFDEAVEAASMALPRLRVNQMTAADVTAARDAATPSTDD